MTAEDRRPNVQEDFKITRSHDLGHVLRRAAGDDRVSVLALTQNPTDDEVRSFTDPRFAFRGFDLVELRRRRAGGGGRPDRLFRRHTDRPVGELECVGGGCYDGRCARARRHFPGADP